VFAISCPPDEPQGPLTCTSTGVQISSPSLPIRLTVKAKGYTFTTFEFEELDPTDDRVEVRVAALQPFSQNALFATGFESTAEAVAFDELAAPEVTELGAPTH